MSSTPSSAPISPWLRLPAVAAIVLGLCALRLAVAASSQLTLDEAYYTIWSLHPDWGYLDHAPMVAWMIAAGRAIAGESEFGVRLLTVLAALPLSAMLYRTGLLLYGRREAALGTIWFNLTLFAAAAFVSTPDIPSVLFWTATLWAVAEFIASRNPWWWLAVGLFAGLGLVGKYTNLFLVAGLLLFLLSAPERRPWLGLWQVWAGVLIAALVFAPVALWNAAHDWASFLFQGKRTVGDPVLEQVLGRAAEFVAGQVLIGGPILAFCLLRGLRFLRGARSLPIVSALPALAYFTYHCLHAQVQLNWTAPLWPGLALAAGAAAVALRPSAPRGTGLYRTALGAHAVGGLILAGILYSQILFAPFAWGSADRTTEFHGWKSLAASFRQQAEARGAQWIGTDGAYGFTGELVAYGHFAGSAIGINPIGQSQRWTYLDRDPARLAWPALLVLPERDPAFVPEELFGTVEALGEVPRNGPRGPLESYRAYLVSDPKPAFIERWGS
jgi:4-amino-4-deoxy-L-arabinose transferase-like glycosyltransferase